MRDLQTRPAYSDPSFIFLIALLSRVVYWSFLNNHYFFHAHPSGDVLYYHNWAQEIASGHWKGGANFWGLPLYPHFLAILDRLALNNMAMVRLLHLALGSLNCVLTYFVGRALFSREVGFLSGLLMAVSFVAIHYDWLMIPVTLLIFLGLVIVLAFVHADKMNRWHEWLILGFLIGLAILGDAKMIVFTCLVSVVFFFASGAQGKQRVFKALIPMAAGIILILGTNGLRNRVTSGDWVWISAQGGLSFYVGNNARATGVFENPDFIRPTHEGQDADQVIVAEISAKRKLTPTQVSQFWRNQGLAFIKSQPLDYLRLLGRKLALFFTETERSYDLDLLLQREWKKIADVNPFWLVCPLAIVGMITSRRVPGVSYVNFMILSQLAITLLFFLTHRHRATILPFLIVYESYVILELIHQLRMKNFKFVLGILIFVVGWGLLFRPQAMAALDVEFYRHTKSGAVYERQKDFRKAQEQYAKALDLRPDDTNAMYNLANVYAMTGNWVFAQEYYQRILVLNPYQVDALYNLGFVQAQLRDYRGSYATFQKLLTLQSQSPDALYEMGKVSQKLGNCSEAKLYFTRLLQMKPYFARELTPIMGSCQESNSRHYSTSEYDAP